MKSRAFSKADIIERVFNRPLAITAEKAQIILGVIGPRLDVGQLVVHGEGGGPIPIASLQMAAAQQAAGLRSDADDPMPGDCDMQPRDWRTGAPVDPYEIFQGVAIITIRGTLMAENGLNPSSGATGYDGISFKFRHALNNPAVVAILFDIDSPGGEITDLHDLADAIASARGQKPMRAMVRGLCASAAYELAAATDEITVSPVGFAGSTGCIMMHADFSKQMEQDGVVVTLIYEGAHKADGNPFEPLPDDVRAEYQRAVSLFYDMFTQRVAAWRGLTVEAVKALESRCYLAEDALQLGLIDKVMSWTDSLNEFVAAVNGRQPPAITNRTAGTGVRASMETIVEVPTTPAAPTPEQNNEQIKVEAHAEGVKAGTTAGAEGERTRVLALIDLCGESQISASLKGAIEQGTEAGAYAIDLTKAANQRGATLEQVATGAVASEQLPNGGAAAGGQPKQGADRGKGILALAAAAGHSALKHLATPK
jgi:signal peptide peptidase SppA